MFENSLSWFKIATNGTPIEEAINVARQPNTHCNHIYNGCGLSADVFQAIMNELGIQWNEFKNKKIIKWFDKSKNEINLNWWKLIVDFCAH